MRVFAMLAASMVALLFTTYAQQENLRAPIALNSRQNLLMNQILAGYALTDSKNALCRNQSKEFQIGLRAFEPWALQMFDASSKLQSGILNGNLMEFGAYKQCLNVYYESSDYGQIRGKQCVVKVKPHIKIIEKILSFRNISHRRFENIKSSVSSAAILWSVCIPDVCNSSDVLNHFNKTILNIIDGIDVKITSPEIDCSSHRDEKPLTRKEQLVIYIFLSIIFIELCCTGVDVWCQKHNTNASSTVQALSIYSNFKYIIKLSPTNELSCLNGIRFLSIASVVVGHQYLMTLFYPSVNSLDVLDWLLEYPSTLIIGATVTVDSFFLLSGLLVAYNFFNFMANGGRFNIILFYVHRYVRLTPLFAVIVFGIATFAHRFGSGPNWKRVCYSVQVPCLKYWWSALLYIQNYVNPKELCVLQTWSLMCDMQFYLFSPVIIYPMFKWKAFGVFNLFFFYFLSLAGNFYLAWKHEYRAGMMIDNDMPTSHYFAYHYTNPHVRASTYIMGLGFGYVLHKTKGEKYTMNGLTVLFGWLTSFVVMCTVILGNHRFQVETYTYNKVEACFFISVTRSAWTLGVMWMIWACRCGYGGPVNAFLSADMFQVLAKVTYAIFLVHMPMQYLVGGAEKNPFYFSNYYTIHTAFGDLTISIAMAFIAAVLIEYPISRLFVVQMRRK